MCYYKLYNCTTNKALSKELINIAYIKRYLKCTRKDCGGRYNVRHNVALSCNSIFFMLYMRRFLVVRAQRIGRVAVTSL